MMLKALVRRFWKPLLAVWATCALGIAVMVGLSGGSLSLQESTEDYLEAYRYYDASITTEVTADDLVSALAAVRGVAHAEARMAANTVMMGPGQRILSIRATTYAPDDWQRFVVWDSVDTHGRDAVLVECEFARNNDIKAGDEVRIRVDGAYRTCLVESLVSAPETLSVRALENQSSLNSDFGAVYVPVSLVAREPNPAHEEAVRELSQREVDLEAVEAQAKTDYDHALDELRAASAELERREAEAREALASLVELRAALDAKEADAREGIAYVQDKEHELTFAREQLELLRTQLTDALRQVADAQKALVQQRAELAKALDDARFGLEELETNIARLEQAQQALKEIDDALAELRDLSELVKGDQLLLLINLLREMNPDTKLSKLTCIADALRDLLELFRECDIELDVTGSLHKVAQTLLNQMDVVEADGKTLSDPAALELARRSGEGDEKARDSAEGQALAKVVRRYTKRPLSEDALLMAASRCQRIQNLVEKHGLRSWVEELLRYTDYSFDDWVGLFGRLGSYVDAVTTFLADGPEITTVGQLLDAFDRLPAAIEAARAKLEATRAEILAMLAQAGVAEDDLTGALDQLRLARAEAQRGLAQLEEGLATIDAALEEARTGTLELEASISQALDGLSQIDAGWEELSGWRQEAFDALQLIIDNRFELDEAQARTQNAVGSLGELEAQLQTRYRDAENRWVQGLIDFSNLRGELEQARAELGSWQGYQVFHNQFLLWFDEGADPKETLAAACDALAPTVVKSSFVYEDSPVKERLDNNVGPFRALSHYMPTVFFAVVLMVTFLFMSLMVRQSRVTIGILRALGKSVGQVRTLFCGMGLLVSVTSFVPGLAIGWGLVRYMGSYYTDFFLLPDFTCRFDEGRLAWALMLTVLVVQLATLVGTTLVAAIQPSEAFSRAIPASARIPRVVSLLTSHLDELSKFSVLSLLRNPLRVGFSVVCIAASVAIILASQSFIASKNYLVRQEFDQRIHYDFQVFLKEDPDARTLQELRRTGCIHDLQRMGFYSCTISSGGTSKEATINAVQYNTDLVGITDALGNSITVPRQGIVLDEHLAQALGVTVGDTVEVERVPLRVEALSQQDTNRVQYVSLETMSALGEGDLGCVIGTVDDADQQRLLESLSERDDYVFTVFTNVMRSSAEHLYATYDLSAWILTGFAVAIGALVVFNVMQANVLERKRELCVLRTLGFDHARLSRSLFWQTMLYVGLACVVGLPAGKVVALRALEIIGTADRSFPYVNGLSEYMIAVLIVVVYAVLSHLIAMHGMRDWDINEGVKEKE